MKKPYRHARPGYIRMLLADATGAIIIIGTFVVLYAVMP